jgi:hypothetical protein
MVLFSEYGAKMAGMTGDARPSGTKDLVSDTPFSNPIGGKGRLRAVTQLRREATAVGTATASPVGFHSPKLRGRVDMAQIGLP